MISSGSNNCSDNMQTDSVPSCGNCYWGIPLLSHGWLGLPYLSEGRKENL